MKGSKKLPAVFLRPPIVVVLGHVDHGKTTLLDYIRKTNVAGKEAGGITQRIGASLITSKEGKKITFIDTPGHAAFSNMRSRGAKVADIAILVVAADDGVKPQTKEALKHIMQAQLPFIVAATKIDLSKANIQSIRSQLEKEGVVFEGSGGDVSLLGVSGKTGQGTDELLEMISLISEVHEVKGDPNGPLEAVVIESSKSKAGPVATLIVRNGKIKVGDEIVTQVSEAKVRGIFDHQGGKVKEINPGEPAQIIGFDSPVPVGTPVWHKKSSQITTFQVSTLVEVKIKEGQIPIILKAQNIGALEAIEANLPKEVAVVTGGVGDVSESDVFMAKSVNAIIFSFESKLPANVAKLAETEGVSIESFNVIYELFEAIESLLKKGKVEILGMAKIVASFPFEKQRIAGCKVIQGKISKGEKLILKRGDLEIGEVKVVTMKKLKQEIVEAKQSEECGILINPQLDFKIGDVLLSVRKSS